MAKNTDVIIMGACRMSRDEFVKEVAGTRNEITELEGKVNTAKSKLARLQAICPHERDQGCPCDICGKPADVDD